MRKDISKYPGRLLRNFRLWKTLGPVETQVLRDLDKTHAELDKRLAKEEQALQEGELNQLEEQMSLFRNFLVVEISQALDRVDQELDYIEGRAKERPEYHKEFVSVAREVSELIDNEAIRLNNAADQARKRLDRNEDLSTVTRNLLEIEEREKDSLEQADRKLDELSEIYNGHRLHFTYYGAKFKRKVKSIVGMLY